MMKLISILTLTVFSFTAIAQSPGTESDPMVPNSGPKEATENIRTQGGAIKLEDKPAVPPGEINHHDHKADKSKKKTKHKRRHGKKHGEGKHHKNDGHAEGENSP